jgi:hypothetical protein
MSEWQYSREIRLRGQLVLPGTELSVDGIWGRCRFIQHVRHGDLEWIDVMTSRDHQRTVRPEKVRTVHRTRRIA